MRVSVEVFSSFEWDLDKCARNIEKHGIDFNRALTALEAPRLEQQSERNGEIRTLAICQEPQKLITIVYTMRGETCRIISIRAARKNEQRAYRQILGR